MTGSQAKARLFGYARVSTTDQSLDIQLAALEAAGVERRDIFSERRSGTTRAGRAQLADALHYMREGDTLIITRLDRLARSLRDLLTIVEEIAAKGFHLRVLEQNVDTGTSAGRAFLGMLGVFAQFETDIRRERQAEGIAKAKADGRMTGRPRTVDKEAVRALAREGVTKYQIAKRLGCDRASVYRALAESA